MVPSVLDHWPLDLSNYILEAPSWFTGILTSLNFNLSLEV